MRREACWLSRSLRHFVTAALANKCVVQSLSRVQLFATPWAAAHQTSLSFTVSQSLFKLMSIESVVPSNHPILCLPLLLLPSVFPSIRVFSDESVFPIRWPKYWSFNFTISPSSEYSGLISFRIDWFDLYLYRYMFMYTCILNKERKENSAFLPPYSPGIASDLQ